MNELQWNKVKVMTVGKEAVGKTSVIRALQPKYKRIQTDQNDVPLSTEGIDIEVWNPKPEKNIKSSKSQQNATFLLWDLGGQEVFYPTHQFFLSPCSIYMIVFDVTQPDWERVTYWVRQIRASAGKANPPVIFVGTHVDMVRVEDLEDVVSYLQQEYRQQGLLFLLFQFLCVFIYLFIFFWHFSFFFSDKKIFLPSPSLPLPLF